MRRDVQAQIVQNRMDALRDSNAVHTKVDQVSEELQKLTAELNQLKPANVQAVGEVQGKVSEEFQQCLVVQSERIDKLSESVIQSQKTAQDTAEMLQIILVGMENMGKNFKQLQENMDYWQMPENPNVEAEHQRFNEELLKEVPLSIPVTLEPMTENASPVISFPQVVTPVSSSSQAKNLPQPQGWSMNDSDNIEWVTGTALSKPYPGAPTPPTALGFDLGQKGQGAQEK